MNYDDPRFEDPYAPADAHGRGGYQPPPEGGAVILVCGILSLVMCAPIGIAAWIMGNNYMRQCRALGAPPDGVATAGRVCGIIGTVLFGLQALMVVVWLLVLGLAVAAN